ncbi:MAG: hypothetical protein JNL82_25415 [Myxococcales bacterium]|nr:hypothetical protein [Myxococcales bacterium]
MRRLLALSVLLACSPAAPRLDGVAPLAGDADGGTAVILRGAGFLERGPLVVYFGMRSARAVVVESDRRISVITPEAEAVGPTDLRVEFADGTVFDLPQAFEYTSADGILQPIPFVPGRTPVPTAE